MAKQKNNEVTYELVEKIGVIKTQPSGWTKELNLIRWGDSAVKYDIRDWSPDHEKMSKVITLHKDELDSLIALASK